MGFPCLLRLLLLLQYPLVCLAVPASEDQHGIDCMQMSESYTVYEFVTMLSNMTLYAIAACEESKEGGTLGKT